MKTILTAAAIAALGASSAFAADLPVRTYTKAPPMMAVPYNWSGFYLGANVGVGVARNLTGYAAPSLNQLPSSYVGPAGAIGGAQAGYNLQYGSWVLGLETDIQASGMRDNLYCGDLCVGVTSTAIQQRLNWFGTTRGRVGYANGPMLTYATAGFAYGGVKTDMAVAFGAVFPPVSFNETRTGYTYGSGVEVALGGNWTGKVEYLYLNLGTQTGVTNFGAAQQVLGSDIREHIFRVGANYRIGGNAAYVAAPLANWNGFYIGGNGGTALARNAATTTLVTPPAAPVANESNRLMPDGYLGGGQIGYNWQSSAWVFGLEADIQASSQRDHRNCGLGCTPGGQLLKVDQRMSWLGTVRGRLGYSVGSNLVYGTAGYAYGGIKNDVSEAIGGASFAGSFKHSKGGWTAGGGIETPFELFGLLGKNWTAKSEYLYVDLGRITDAYTFAGFNHTITSRVQEHIMRTGINYHFNTPVVAKY